MPVPGPPPRPVDERPPGATKGRKACTVCGKRPKSMLEHFNEQKNEGYQAHGPTSSQNPNALANLPGLKAISDSLEGIFTDRRMPGSYDKAIGAGFPGGGWQ